MHIQYLKPKVFGQHHGNVLGQANTLEYLYGVIGAVQAQTAYHFGGTYTIKNNKTRFQQQISASKQMFFFFLGVQSYRYTKVAVYMVSITTVMLIAEQISVNWCVITVLFCNS